MKGIKCMDRGMETPRGAGALCTVTSLYLFTDRRVQRWVRYSSSAGSAAQEQGFSLIPEACLLIFLGDLSSRERTTEAGS